MPQVGDKVIPERSKSTWEITHVSTDGKEVNLNLPGTNLDRFRVRADNLEVCRYGATDEEARGRRSS
jgi:hypothetical protein